MLRQVSMRAAIGTLAAVALGVSCSSAGSGGVAAPAPTASHDMAGMASAAPGATPGASDDTAAMKLPDLGVRSDLEQLLGQHAFLTVQVMRSRLRGDPDFAQATETAVSGNTDDLTAQMTKAFGAQAGQRFRTLWQAQTLTMIDYARAVSKKDAAGITKDRTQLAGYVGATSAYFSTVTKGKVATSTAMRALGTDVTNLLTSTDAYAAGEYPKAFSLESQSFDHMVALGTALAAAITELKTGTLPASFDSPVQRLQSALGADLGGHFEIAVDAMRAGYSNAPDFNAAADTLNKNTQSLAGAFDVLFGKAAAQQFATLWGNHVDALVRYTAATANKNGAGQKKAMADLHAFEQGLGAFLSTGTQGRLTKPALADGLSAHDKMLVAQINAYGAQDYNKAHQISFEGYQHMFVVGSELATAVGPTVAAKLPKGGVQTGGGGTAAR